MASPIVLLRHTRVKAEGICYGRAGVPLARTFAREAAAVRAQLPFAPAVVWTSPAARCRQLATTLHAGEVRVDGRLWELDFGAWEGRKWDDVPRAEIDAWAEDYVRRSPPGGESFLQVAARVADFRAELAARGERRVVVVTHGGVIRAWLCALEGRPLTDAWARPVDFGAVVPVSA